MSPEDLLPRPSMTVPRPITVDWHRFAAPGWLIYADAPRDVGLALVLPAQPDHPINLALLQAHRPSAATTPAWFPAETWDCRQALLDIEGRWTWAERLRATVAPGQAALNVVDPDSGDSLLWHLAQMPVSNAQETREYHRFLLVALEAGALLGQANHQGETPYERLVPRLTQAPVALAEHLLRHGLSQATTHDRARARL